MQAALPARRVSSRLLAPLHARLAWLEPTRNLVLPHAPLVWLVSFLLPEHQPAVAALLVLLVNQLARLFAPTAQLANIQLLEPLIVSIVPSEVSLPLLDLARVPLAPQVPSLLLLDFPFALLAPLVKSQRLTASPVSIVGWELSQLLAVPFVLIVLLVPLRRLWAYQSAQIAVPETPLSPKLQLVSSALLVRLRRQREASVINVLLVNLII
jgi:hypothetical protein